MHENVEDPNYVEDHLSVFNKNWSFVIFKPIKYNDWPNASHVTLFASLLDQS